MDTGQDANEQGPATIWRPGPRRHGRLVGAEALNRYIRSSTPGDDLDFVVDAFAAHLTATMASAADWADAIGRFDGADAVALLTAHRSKGLEYHTVFFLGLDDQQ
jgi:superfamily I DNA/RNA helicase